MNIFGLDQGWVGLKNIFARLGGMEDPLQLNQIKTIVLLCKKYAFAENNMLRFHRAKLVDFRAEKRDFGIES